MYSDITKTNLIGLKEQIDKELHRNPDDRYWQTVKVIVEYLLEEKE